MIAEVAGMYETVAKATFITAVDIGPRDAYVAEKNEPDITEESVDYEVPQPVTLLLARWRSGDSAALEALIPFVYEELRRLARYQLRREREDHTLQSTALVNEAYLRLVGQEVGQVENRAHFLAISAHLMRQVLVDHARARRAAKRNGGSRVELREAEHPLQTTNVDVIALDEALTKLAQFDAELCRLVEMRFLGGLSIEDTAQAMGISPATVKREWATARAWLSRELGEKS
jgi:RNA polymerase sigma factor (TIGR02999 family)